MDDGGETTSSSSSVGLTLGGILSIKQTTPYRVRDRERTLLDLIRDDQSLGKDSKMTWKTFREKLRLKLSGSACTTAVPAVASHAHVSTERNRLPTQSASVSVSPPVNNTNSNAHVNNDVHAHVSTESNRFPTQSVSVSVPASPPVNNTSSNAHVRTEGNRFQTQTVNVQTEMPEVGRTVGGDGGGTAAVRMSLMSLLEVEASAYVDYGGEEEEEDEEVAVEETGGYGGGGGGGYNNCCVCMVRHKGAAFIPCGHTFCRLCSRELFVKRASCPLCNNFILEILDIF